MLCDGESVAAGANGGRLEHIKPRTFTPAELATDTKK
jgi:hypothetical protein